MNELWTAGEPRHGYKLVDGRMVRKCDGRKTYMEALVAVVVPTPPADKASAKKSGYCPRCLERR